MNRRKSRKEKMAGRIYLISLCMLIAFTLMGCGGEKAGPADTKDKLKIGILYKGEKQAGSYINVHYAGIRSALSELGLYYDKVVTEEENVVASGSDCVLKIRNMIQKGCNLIIGTDKAYNQDMYTLAGSPQYENVRFMNYTDNFTGLSPMGRYYGDMSQAVFLSGVVAGKKTVKDKIGYIIKNGDTDSIVYANAFALGAAAVNPDVTIFVKQAEGAKQEQRAAEELGDTGCDVVSQCTDSLALHEILNNMDVFSIHNSDEMSLELPEYVLCSTVWNWQVFYYEQISKILDGSWTGSDRKEELRSNVMELKINRDDETKEIKAAVDEYKQKIERGAFDVFGYRIIKDNRGNVRTNEDIRLSVYDLNHMDWFVENITVR